MSERLTCPFIFRKNFFASCIEGMAGIANWTDMEWDWTEDASRVAAKPQSAMNRQMAFCMCKESCNDDLGSCRARTCILTTIF